MARSISKISNIVLRKGVHIGEPSAEDDSVLLSQCFVELAAFGQIRDIDSSKCVILGRTGSGKSALLLELEKVEEGCIRLDPKEFAFSYLSNSNIINFVIEIGCDVHILFEYLWKHVLFCKMVSVYFSNRSYLETKLDSLVNRNSKALKYFKKFEDKFWIEQDTTVREISSSFEESIKAELKAVLGSDYAKFEQSLDANFSFQAGQKDQIVFRVKRAISQLQMQELSAAVAEFEKIISNNKKRYYILIDDLDGDWSDSSIKYQMIRSLVESTKSLRKIRNIKIIMCLRSDVYEKSILIYRGDGYQPEKYEGLVTEIKWDLVSLRLLVDKRIEAVFKHQYTKDNIGFFDVFPLSIRKQPAFDFLIDRTQWRPRDIIAFINSILEYCSGSNVLVEKKILEAEADYSKKRYDALRREWQLVHPYIDVYLKFLKGRTGNCSFADIAVAEIIEDICLELDTSEEKIPNDDVERSCKRYVKRQQSKRISDIARSLLATLYKVGAISLKMTKGDSFKVCFKQESNVLDEQISDEAVFQVVPMLWRSLGITPNL